ncbi:hypothetical protein [Mesorhizobium sp.]|uniref:hypothetical protein n=1 Tax=Mesorhizobium sp. TaxID=1871066 RepID=UPI001217E2B0|nr:hypothetical protein [Mesorhizobium sp.]TIL43717.1 MAG: hypothetical protein E5Y86_20480 [Mesorhizobium sp.]
MTIETIATFAATVQPMVTLAESVIQSAAILVAAWWTYNRFIKQEESHAHIETSAEIVVKGRQGDDWIVELLAFVENKGKVAHKMKKFNFDLNTISCQKPIGTSDSWDGQVHFPNDTAKGSMIPSHFQYFIIGPSVKAKYSYIARVPISESFAIFHCRFEYADRPHLGHSMEATIKLPSIEPATVSD